MSKTLEALEKRLKQRITRMERRVLTDAIEDYKNWINGNHPRRRWKTTPETRAPMIYLFNVGFKPSLMYIRPSPKTKKRKWYAPDCYNEICGLDILRPHFTCLYGCRQKRIWKGKHSPVFPVNQLELYQTKGLPKWKQTLAKRVFSVLEWLYT